MEDGWKNVEKKRKWLDDTNHGSKLVKVIRHCVPRAFFSHAPLASMCNFFSCYANWEPVLVYDSEFKGRHWDIQSLSGKIYETQSLAT